MLDYAAGLCRIMWRVCVGLCGRSVSDHAAVNVGLCDSSVSDYVAGLSRIMWQVCVRQCGSSVSDYVTDPCRIM